MKMTIKKKMVAGGIAFGIVAGTGFGLANTDAGGALKGWYDKLFGNTSQQVAEDVSDHGTSKLSDLWDQYDKDKENADLTIGAIGTTEKNRVNGAIEKAKQAHMNSLASSEDGIMSGMDSQFEQLFNDGKYAIDALKKYALNYAKGDLTVFANQKGDAAKEQLKKDIEDSSKQAVADLEAAIATAKANLTKKLNENKDATTEDLKGYLEDEVADAQNQLRDIIQGLMEDQYDKITAAGAEYEDDAKGALDAVVAGIDQ